MLKPNFRNYSNNIQTVLRLQQCNIDISDFVGYINKIDVVLERCLFTFRDAFAFITPFKFLTQQLFAKSSALIFLNFWKYSNVTITINRKSIVISENDTIPHAFRVLILNILYITVLKAPIPLFFPGFQFFNTIIHQKE